MTSAVNLGNRLSSLAPWYFKIEVSPGVWTHEYNKHDYADPDDKYAEYAVDPKGILPLLNRVFPNGLGGMSFLDAGCNSGGYCFVAHELGAKMVYGFDVREHWIKQANFIKDMKYGNAESIQFSCADINSFDSREQFDITVFNGVFYHLPNPIADLNRICRMTKRAIVVGTSSHNGIPEKCLLPIQESTTRKLSGVNGLAWLPGGPEALRPILKWSGFEHMRVEFWNKDHAVGGDDWGRFRIIAARDRETFKSFDGG